MTIGIALDSTPSYIEGLTTNETLHYRLIGRSSTGEPDVDVAEACPECWAWPVVCKGSCEAAQYAWTLRGRSNGAETFIELLDGVNGDQPFYFYVPHSLWSEFISDNPTSTAFGFSNEWDALKNRADNPNDFEPAWECIKVNALTGSERMLNGFVVGANYAGQVGYGFRKDRGEWRSLSQETASLAQPGQVCPNLIDFYNWDAQVEQARITLGLPILSCSPLFGTSVMLDWGAGGPSACSSIPLVPFDGPDVDSLSNLDVNLAVWAEQVLDCYEPPYTGEPGAGSGTSVGGLQDVNDIVVTSWKPKSYSEVLRVAPHSRDPRLMAIESTKLEPGLYEFRILLENGTILRHFEEVVRPMTLRADFANFVDINIYPVPVKDQTFAIDFDLHDASVINLHIVNNTGTPVHSEELRFDVVGRNKAVIKMDNPWPEGIYHANFQFHNGTVQGRSFIVQY